MDQVRGEVGGGRGMQEGGGDRGDQAQPRSDLSLCVSTRKTEKTTLPQTPELILANGLIQPLHKGMRFKPLGLVKKQPCVNIHDPQDHRRVGSVILLSPHCVREPSLLLLSQLVITFCLSIQRSMDTWVGVTS